MTRVTPLGALAVLALVAASPWAVRAEDDILRPLGMGGLSRLSKARTRSISPENFTGREGQGRDGDGGHGRERRPRPRPRVEDLAFGPDPARRRPSPWREIQGEGAIQHIWMTPTGPWRHFVFRIYWDGEATPVRGVARRRLLRLRLGRLRADLVAARCA